MGGMEALEKGIGLGKGLFYDWVGCP